MYSATVLYCMEIHNADMFGGKGSVGYTHRKFMEIYPLQQSHEELEALCERIAIETARHLGISSSDVKFISEKEYNKVTRDDVVKESIDVYDETEEEE